MRRLICAALLVASSIGFLAIPAGADTSSPNKLALSFDYSDNNSPASASNGSFNIIVDVLPEHTQGLIKIVAVAPGVSDLPNLTCSYQAVVQGQVECAFNFPSSGVWTIRGLFAVNNKADVTAFASTSLRVGN
jgi:hypothetical protein